MSNIIPFNFKGKEIRTIQDENGDPWFVANDIAKVLEYQEPKSAVRLHCKKVNKIKGCKISSRYLPHIEINIIPESDLYRLIMRSKMPGAEAFQDWVVEEVLPTIRKTGSYSVPQNLNVDLNKFEAELLGAKFGSEMCRWSDVSKLEILHSIYEDNGVSTAALPIYTPKVKVTFSASDLLKKNDCDISTRTFNKLMLDYGFLEEKERTGNGGKIKKYKALTVAGLEYGQNDTSKYNPREVQPHYFEDSFMELYGKITRPQLKVVSN